MSVTRREYFCATYIVPIDAAIDSKLSTPRAVNANAAFPFPCNASAANSP